MRRVLPVVFCGLLLAVAVSPASAQQKLVTARDPAVILEIAKGYGRATLSKDKQGDPYISGKMDGLVYNIFFYNCKKGTDCEVIQFETGWGKELKKPSLSDLNEWNNKKLFAHAFINKHGLVRLRVDVLLRHGVTEKNLDAYFDAWRSLLKEFHNTVMVKIQ